MNDDRSILDQAIADFQAGLRRQENFRLIYEMLFPRLVSFFARLGARPQDRSDLAQETLLGIYRGLDSYRHESSPFTWLYTVARNVYRKQLRQATTAKRDGQELSSDDDMLPELLPPTPATQLIELDQKERREAMYSAVRRLPEKQRMCLNLRLNHQLKYREIASVMKIEINTVKAHLSQAKQRLKKDIGATFPLDSDDGNYA